MLPNHRRGRGGEKKRLGGHILLGEDWQVLGGVALSLSRTLGKVGKALGKHQVEQ